VESANLFTVFYRCFKRTENAVSKKKKKQQQNTRSPMKFDRSGKKFGYEK